MAIDLASFDPNRTWPRDGVGMTGCLRTQGRETWVTEGQKSGLPLTRLLRVQTPGAEHTPSPAFPGLTACFPTLMAIVLYQHLDLSQVTAEGAHSGLGSSGRGLQCMNGAVLRIQGAEVRQDGAPWQ